MTDAPAASRANIDLDAFIHRNQIEGSILELPVETPTVESAALAVGTTVGQIVKSLLFLANHKPVLVIACGTSLISRRRLAAHFGLSPKRVRLADPATTLAVTGFPVGALPPFGHATALPTLLDRAVLTKREVFAGGGSTRTLLRIRSEEIARVTQAVVLDLVEIAGAPTP
jgi:prolyl-tRNA editing enzyme YbaK/EbsC (Cys-tRNA(Pro) deacylase)